MPTIGIAGAGIGGLTAAIALRQRGFDIVVFEQAPGFARVGADINLTPNATRALDGLGIGAELRTTAAQPTHRISRTWDTGEETSRLGMAEVALEKYGAPQLTLHRADLMHALEQELPAEAVRFGKRLSGLTDTGSGIELRFDDGSTETVDALIGADGIHSVVRRELFGADTPRFTGLVAYRAVVPMSTIPDALNKEAFTKWWGPTADIQIVTFPINSGDDMFIFATTPQESWRDESWTQPGDVVELREMYKDFHPEARGILAAVQEVLKSALYVREPMPEWGRGPITLVGDAAHPMVPFMAQGAGQAIEDAIVLARALDEGRDDPAAAMRRYEAARQERTARIQRSSLQNEWLKEGGNADWVYDYNPWDAPLA